MPIITLQYEDLESLTKADKDTIIDRVPMIGADIERIEKESIDIEFFPDRPDLYSVEGVARAMRGFMNIETGLCQYDVTPSDVHIELEEGIKDVRPVIGCAIVRGINFTSSSIKSLMDLQEDLHWGLGRNRKKVSIGVHDMTDLKPPFKYQAVSPDFEFVPLDFTEPMTMDEILEKHPKGVRFAKILEGMEKYPLISDSEGNVLSFPPIINGTLTRVEESTTDLFVDVTGLGDAVYTALSIVVSALAERGGKIESVKVVYPDGTEKVTPDMTPRTLKVPRSDIDSLIGIELTADEIVNELKRMRFDANILEDGEMFEISVPTYRADILHNYDIVEDIAIGYGFDKIKSEFPKSATIGCAHPISITRGVMREIMVSLGYSEVMPFTLTSQKVHFEWMNREKTDDVTFVLHPISEDQTMVRTTILPNLIEIFSLNQHHELPQCLFEVGEVVVNSKNRLHLAAASIHAQANFTEIREVLDGVMRERDIEYEVVVSDDPAFIEGRRADILVNGEKVGMMGELYPEVITNFGLGQPIVGFEIDLTD
ncbi:phenylalanine--tRNA ligase subunit beta [Methanococcoides alaskense]|uniref:Phenylalanine--tRNA ligase beta subunit n=1 Tax=Methanococcoides alaskense TaxID=325778 RepID=A0AA90TZC1_9EURY|nr:phenylalanine--tRNA ligase subunit beta [Methanococcoides alaskense]MDA0525675.1 phenylalanine--tRNA ligase subunit beta [Methanococcoides alaskense]MDR6222900.1 phenylalanyl-tRNA synthetase beta chain [Methanococcoides alaskense]